MRNMGKMNWQGRLDSNQRMRESKSLALPLGDAPMWKEQGTGGNPDPLLCLGWEMGLEPTTPGTTIRCSNQLSYTHHILARLKGLEPLTHCLEGSCSIHLSYKRMLPFTKGIILERVMGIEPTRPAWKAGVLPLNYTRIHSAIYFSINLSEKSR